MGLFAALASTVLDGRGATQSDLTAAQIETMRKDNPGVTFLVVPQPVVAGAPPPSGDIKAAVSPSVAKSELLYSVTLPARPADDFMKQMLTLVGTLMTAITAFYFGGRTATTTDPTRGPPKLAAVTNNPIPRLSTNRHEFSVVYLSPRES